MAVKLGKLAFFVGVALIVFILLVFLMQPKPESSPPPTEEPPTTTEPTPPPQLPNLISNPSVELDTDNNGMPDGWLFWHYKDVPATGKWITVETHTGQYALTIDLTYNASALGWHDAIWYQRITTLKVGQTYHTRFWYKSNIPVWVDVGFYNASDKWIKGFSLKASASTSWKQTPWLTFTVEPGVAIVKVAARVNVGDAVQGQANQCFFDDFELYEGTAPLQIIIPWW
jgi:hypothetical protein